MPQIVIREHDKTKAGLGTYSNFSVLIPGFISSTAVATDLWDDNDILELNNQADFEKYIGKVAADVNPQTAEAPVFTYPEAWRVEEKDGDVVTAVTYNITGKLTADEFYGTFGGRVYEKVAWEAGITPYDGELAVAATAEDEVETDPETGVVTTHKGAEQGRYVKRTQGWNANTNYCIIEPENIGRDARSVTPQIGNQIAYELLGLGYTVLYKKIIAENIAFSNNDEESSGIQMSEYDFWRPFEDKATYDFRYVVTGFCGEDDTQPYKDVNSRISELANARGDCIALVDIPKEVYKTYSSWKSDVIAYANALSNANKYTALFMPVVTYDMNSDATYQNDTFPAYFHYLLCASDAFVNYPEWFAVAGYTRGISSVYNIKSTQIKLGDAAINALEPRSTSGTGRLTKAINVVANIKGTYYLWGNRTAHLLGTTGDPVNGDLVASHFLNIRQLCTTLKKQLYVACRKFTFDPNSDTLWANFCNAITPTLDKMKANQGIDDYKIIKVPTDTKALLQAKIRIVPIEAVEDFEIDLYLEDSISGADVEIDEGTVGTNN